MVKNLFPSQVLVSRAERSRLKKQKPCVLWFTGLSGAGKSTVAMALDKKLYRLGYHTYVLDGDNIRAGLNNDLDFTDDDRHENIRRVGELARIFADAGLIVLVAFIAPFRKDRRVAKKLMPPKEFIEIFVNASFAVCLQRDPKKIYKKAYSGKLEHMTGLSSTYEEPRNPEIILNTEKESPQESVEKVYNYLKENGFLSRLS